MANAPYRPRTAHKFHVRLQRVLALESFLMESYLVDFSRGYCQLVSQNISETANKLGQFILKSDYSVQGGWNL